MELEGDLEYDLDNFEQYINNGPELEELLVNMYKSGKYSHRDVAYLFNHRFDDNIYYVKNAVARIIDIMIEKEEKPQYVCGLIDRWENRRMFKIQDEWLHDLNINIYEILSHNINVVPFIPYVNINIFLTYIYRNEGEKKLKETLNSLKDANYNGNDLLISYLTGSVMYYDATQISKFIIEVVGVDFNNLRSNDPNVMKYIEKLRVDGV